MGSKNKIKISFLGGTESVTGSNFLLADLEGGTKILVDCGLFEGTREEERRNGEGFPFVPSKISAVFVTHAHLDHIGRLPKLVKEGFHGVIYSTPPTKEISEASLLDAVGIQKKEERRGGEPQLYDENDVQQTMKLWRTIKYHQPVAAGDFSVVLYDSGHILGSAMIEIMFKNSREKIMFTGDLGNSPAPLLKDTEKVADISYLIMESVYGDRNHEGREERKYKLENVIEDTIRRGGTLLIPAFSIERTQELLFEIENMMENSKIPLVPVFLDSPLAIEVTRIYKKYEDYFNKEVKYIINSGDGIFKFSQFHETLTTEESKTIERANQRKIIMAGSGMSNGGRIIHHEKRFLPDPKSTLLLVGYQSVGTLGRIIQDGARFVRIMGEEVPINARVVSLSGYSAHKDADGLFGFVQESADTLKRVFVVMGELKASLHLVQRLRDYLGLDAVAPKAGEEVVISL